jgi:hypothetical protein
VALVSALLVAGDVFARCDVIEPRPGNAAYAQVIYENDIVRLPDSTKIPDDLAATSSDSKPNNEDLASNTNIDAENKDLSVAVADHPPDDPSAIEASGEEVAQPQDLQVQSGLGSNDLEADMALPSPLSADDSVALMGPVTPEIVLEPVVESVPQFKFTVSGGQTLRENLQVWANHVGISLVWSSTKDARVVADFDFGSDFEAAVKALFQHFPDFNYNHHLNAMEVTRAY